MVQRAKLHQTIWKVANDLRGSVDLAETIREETVDKKGFFILPSELFENVRRNAESDSNLMQMYASQAGKSGRRSE